MAELSILKPQVLNGVLREIPVPESFLGSRLFPREAYPFTTVKYDIYGTLRDTAKPNMPGAPAHIVGTQPIGQVAYGMLYTREKKVFDPVTMYWLRAVGTINNAQKYAEEHVRREIEHLNMRLERFVERVIWQALTTGHIVLNTPEVKADIDFKFRADHLITKASGLWNDPAADIIGDVEAYKRQFVNDSNTPATTVYCNSKTLALLSKNDEVRSLMSEAQKAAYLQTGSIPALLSLTWVPYDGTYVDDTGAQKMYIPDGKFVFLSTANDAFKLLEGPSADMAAQGASGKFGKTWEEEDPSARQVLTEYTFGPAIQRPDQVLVVQAAPESF